LYEYECAACGGRFEMIQKFSDDPPAQCRICGKGPVTRLLSSPAIQFKGTGWYITDYAKKGQTDASSTKTGDSAKTDSPKTETKSEPAAKADTTAAKSDKT
jgi:putative FmdB family regulatory protein